jgi:KaiC/GvpD/RAD55 family RecA-like ATPase
MNKSTLSLASYWRNSLADSELGKGAWGNGESIDAVARPDDELKLGLLDTQVAEDFFRTEKAEADTVEVALYPLVYRLKTEHGSGKHFSMPKILAPVVVKALIKRDGTIIPLPQIFIARDVLEPIDKNVFSIGHIDDLDIFLTTHPSPIPSTILCLYDLEEPDKTLDQDLDKSPARLNQIWDDMLRYCECMLESVCNGKHLPENGYLKSADWYIRKAGTGESPARKITALYDHMRQANPDVPLLDTYASLESKPAEAILSRSSGFSQHSGHSSDKYPLSDAQRDALNHLLASQESEILAVNGPPGTGKTTLLLSVVSSLWVEAALKGDKPPVIVASSTNNQAVTNIIDAFKRDFSAGTGPFAGRWIPKVNSFGMYMSSRAKKAQNGNKYITDEFLQEMESFQFIEEARSAYLESARAAFPDLIAPSVSNVVNKIRNLLIKEHEKLSQIHKGYNRIEALKQKVNKTLSVNHWEEIEKLEKAADEAKKKHKVLQDIHLSLINHIGNEPFWFELFDFLPPVSKRRGIKASIVVKRMLKGIPADKVWENVDEIKALLLEKIETLKASSDKATQRLRYANKMVSDLKSAEAMLAETLKSLCLAEEKPPKNLHEANVLADTRIRFKLFTLAVHYWEGRWLLEVDGNDDELLDVRGKNGRQVIEDRWRRRMMLTPCAVSTFYMLPGEMRFIRHEGEYVADYLYNFIDLLIVDEAGQVLPEVAGANFALAKRAVVIGDVLQIEPIWSIPRSVDIGNLIHHGGLPQSFIENDLAHLESLGKTSSSGNVMTIAQSVSRYHYDEDMPRGMFLYEHRRCFDEIVAFCNALCYKNKLIPKRGSRKHEQGALPALGYMDITGLCRTKTSGTRYNSAEASLIAAWVNEKKEELEAKYGSSICDVIGIVTPFSGQVDAIRNALKKYGIPTNCEGGMTVGTVHSLQGAERNVIVFSPTYSVENDGGFIDASPSMLNVAVSRAKDSFLVFGDMRTFKSKGPKTPRGLLHAFLMKSSDNMLAG